MTQKLPLIAEKVWGREFWWVNEDEYCFKTLVLNKGASGSLHYHKRKKETFILHKGKVRLEVGEMLVIIFVKTMPPVTIPPGIHHRFFGQEDSEIFEISTHHSEEDVVRIEPSRSA